MAFLHRRAAAHADDPADTFDQPPCLAVGLAPVDSLMHPIAGVFPAGTRARPFTPVWFCSRPCWCCSGAILIGMSVVRPVSVSPAWESFPSCQRLGRVISGAPEKFMFEGTNCVLSFVVRRGFAGRSLWIIGAGFIVTGFSFWKISVYLNAF